MRFKIFALTTLVGIALCAGCAVPQPRGGGKYQFVQEPSTKTWYHLYLPVDYVKNAGRHPDSNQQRWPLVMTFHGMKPYDCATAQEKEWEKEADHYGYIVCAPELNTCDSFMEYPLTKEHGYVLKDRAGVIAIMDHIFQTTNADPKRVLSTSWSCGGYLAHYFANRYPNRFACVATRLSNFSSSLMMETTVPLYKDRVPVAIFIGDSDFPACKSESEEAVAWYTARGFRTVRGKMIDHQGHSRIPQTAAAFFAEQLNIAPLHPAEAAKTVAMVRMTEFYPPQGMIARYTPPSRLGAPPMSMASTDSSRNYSPNSGSKPPVPPPTLARHESSTPIFANANSGRNYPSDRTPQFSGSPRKDAEKSNLPANAVTVADAKKPENRSESAKPTNPGGTWLNPLKKSPAPPRSAVASAESQERHQTPPAPKASNPPARPVTREPQVARSTEPVNKPQPKPQPAERYATQTKRPSREEPAPTRTNNTTRKPARPREEQVAKADTPSRARQAPRPAPVDTPVKATTPPKPSPSTARNFTPHSAGPRDYNPQVARADSRRDARTDSHGAVYAARTQEPAASNEQPSYTRGTGRASKVSIHLSGPSIGTAPHYIAYGLDLPPEKTAGADFLWMDNGVWIGDEAKGSKILENPGLHRISVLVLTRDDKEYRGSATVQVLERGSTASSYGSNSHANQ